MIHLKNLSLLVTKIKKQFYVVVNLKAKARKDTIQVINEPQFIVLNALDKDAIDSLSLPAKTISTCLDRLSSLGYTTKPSSSSPPSSSPKKTKSLNFWVHLTNACTLRCSYCTIPHSPGKMNESTFLAFGKTLINSAKEGNLTKVTLRFAGGEPTLEKKTLFREVPRLKEALSKHGCELRCVFITNLTTMTPDLVEFIKKEKIGISVSLDGVGGFNDSTRFFQSGNGSFDVICKNLDYLISEGIKPFILTVVSDSNVEGLPDLVRFLVKKDLGFRLNLVKEEVVNKIRLSEKLDEVYSIVEDAINNGYNFTYRHGFCDLNLLNPNPRACGAGISAGTLRMNGDLALCPHQVGLEGFGNIHDSKTITEIMDKSGGEKLHENNSTCSACKYSLVCAGACPFAEQIHCDLMKEVIPKIYRLMGLQKLNQMLN